MKYVWLVIDKESNKVLALYTEADMANKLAPVVAKKSGVDVRVEKRTLNLPIEQVGTRL